MTHILTAATLATAVLSGIVLPAQETSALTKLSRIAKIKDSTARLKAYDAFVALSVARITVEKMLGEAAEARAESVLTKTRTATSDALAKALTKAWSATAPLKSKSGRDTLRMLIHNSRGACQETLGLLAKHRRKQEVPKIKAHQQNKAILAYERAVKLKDEGPESDAAKAWALYRIAVLGEEIAKYHEGIAASYRRHRKSYPQADYVGKYRIQAHRARQSLASKMKSDDDKFGDKLMDEGRAQVVDQMVRAHEWATQEQEVLAALDVTEAMRQARVAINIWNEFRKAAGIPEVRR
jgi:hypothetical protein